MRDYDDYEGEREPREIATATLDQPSTCSICGRPDQKYACFRCGNPVCYNQQNYWSDSTCGGWILDTWHPGHPDDNEFYCRMCLHAGLNERGVAVGDLTFTYTNRKTLTITVDGVERELDIESTRDLVAYLYDQRGELFVNPSTENTLELVAVGDDVLGDLDEHPF